MSDAPDKSELLGRAGLRQIIRALNQIEKRDQIDPRELLNVLRSIEVLGKTQAGEQLTAQQLAKRFGCSHQQVARMRRLGLPMQANARYDLNECIHWLYKQHEAYRRDIARFDKLKDMSEGFKRARAQLAEIELAQKRGTLVDRESVERGRTARVHAVRAELERLPKTMPRLLAGRTPPEMQTLLTAEVERLCSVFAGGALSFAPADPAVGSENEDATENSEMAARKTTKRKTAGAKSASKRSGGAARKTKAAKRSSKRKA